jgi:Integrase zinc binding domain
MTQTEDGFLRHDGRIYVPESENLRLRVLQYKHDHVLLGHFGQNKTLALSRREYTWPGLRSFVIEFCMSCTTCMRCKSQCHRPYGFLQQLLIPEQLWNSISMDFIEQLLGSLGFTAILVVVCRFTNRAFSFPRMTRSRQLTSQNYSSCMCSPSTESRRMSLPIEDPNLSRTSFGPSEKHST